MIIGDKDIFAVEYKLCNNYSELLDGTFSYWINQKQLGDENRLVYLSDVLMCMTWINHDNWNRLYCENFIENKLENLFNELSNKIYETDDIREWENCPAKFDISINISNGLGKYRVFYVEDCKYGYLLFKHSQSELIDKLTVKKGYVDSVLSKAYLELDSLYKKINEIKNKKQE